MNYPEQFNSTISMLLNLRKSLDTQIRMINTNQKKKLKNRGYLSYKKGKEYEIQVYNILKLCKINNHYFNTQHLYELGGNTNKNDIECNLNKNYDIPIEIKKKSSPDWMQCSLHFNNNKWETKPKGKITDQNRYLFNELLQNKNDGNILFNNNIPIFFKKKITHYEWTNIKKNTTDFNDIYFNIPNNTIRNLYNNKGCFYIQISNKGLYHLGNDICNFGVPEFNCKQEMRIRIKIHKKKDKNGFCKLSVMAACKPKNINKIKNSPYSLDRIDRLPKNLLYKY